jgi:Ca-activated chloride channel family protein
MRKILFHIIILLLPLFAQSQGAKPVTKTRILFVLDVSGSMMNAWGSSHRFRISKNILSSLVDSLQKTPNLEMGLRVFGSMSPLNANDCKNTRLEAAIRPNNAANIKAKLNALNARGITPIAYALEQCANDFMYSNENTRNIVILITDGIESCDGNACEVSKKLQQKGIFLQPFIIGLGLTKEAAETFECVGRYDDAQDELGFKNALNSVMHTILRNSTLQVNLLDENNRATESNVPISFYDESAGILRYHFMHTLNARGNPDTLQIDPVNSYQMLVHTQPPFLQEKISIEPNRHNVVSAKVPQGDLLIQTDGLSTYKELTCIVRSNDAASANWKDQIALGQKKKYLAGSYSLQLLSLPRIEIDNVNIRASETTQIKIPAPGLLTILNTNAVPVLGSIYVQKGTDLEWVCKINGNSLTETILLQPGSYQLVYKSKGSKRAMSSKTEKFQISSGSSHSIRF